LVLVQNLDDNEETTIESGTASISVIGLMPGTYYEFRLISIGALSVTNTNQSAVARVQTGKTNPRCVIICVTNSGTCKLIRLRL